MARQNGMGTANENIPDYYRRMDTSKNTSKNSNKRSRPTSQKGSPNRKTSKRVKLEKARSRSKSSSNGSVSSNKSKTQKSKSIEYEVLPDDPIDFEEWVHIAKNFVQKVHQKLFKPKFSIVQHQETIQKPLVEIGVIAAELYAKLHGIIALELDIPVQCGNVLHAPNVGTGNLIHGITKRAKEILKEDIEKLTKKQKAINDAYTKALMANRTEIELQGPDSNAARFPPVPPEVNPILFAYINDKIYDEAIKDRLSIASKDFYINIVDAAEKYKKDLSKIITIYEGNQIVDYESQTYAELSEELQSFYREHLLVSIMLDQDVDVPSVNHEGGANEIRNKTIKRLCKFYKTIQETPDFDNVKFSPPKYVRGNPKNTIQYMVDPNYGYIQFKLAKDKEFKISMYNDIMKTHAAILRGEDPSKRSLNSKNKTAKANK
jgi:hypothetical protein